MILCVSAIIENLSEPFYARILLSGDFKNKVYAEGVSIFVKSATTYLLLKMEMGLLAYAVA